LMPAPIFRSADQAVWRFTALDLPR
jgi:hypothetical protein